MSDKQFNPERRIYDHSSYTRFRPLTSTFHNEQFKMRNSFQISAKENEEIESELVTKSLCTDLTILVPHRI